ncbi:hypothetical protein CC86DRAFT_404001 [Ophiobolus disseminans]|uniref:Uncharacterized protein n=1 Tax=Ophiobolus disseminans TaxID=1469910 RepID=A0A6A7A7U7_9PLEO|nr:hypothetical protein CC86DRAFT_404001 [Ophiobolus disseminans]
MAPNTNESVVEDAGVEIKNASPQQQQPTPASSADSAKIDELSVRVAGATRTIRSSKGAATSGEQKEWKDWVNEHILGDEDAKLPPTDDDCLTATKCKDYFKIAGDELKCLQHDARPSPHGGRLPPLKLYKYDEVERLAYKKEAILAGVSQDNEETLIARGKVLWEKEYGPATHPHAIRMGEPSPMKKKGSPRKKARRGSDSEGYSSEDGYDPGENNMSDIGWLQKKPMREW